MSSDEEDRQARFFAEDCPECGTPGPERVLSTVSGCGTCMRDNPVPVHVPVRNTAIKVYDMVLPKPYAGPFLAPFRKGGLTLPPPTECYRLASGSMVHVRPGCRC